MYPRRYGKRYVRKRAPRRFARKRNIRAPFKRYKTMANRTHMFTREAALGGVVEQALGLDNFLGYKFKLNDVPDYQEFTNLFDLYQISKIVMQFRFATNFQVWTQRRPTMYIVHDYNDATAYSTYNAFLETANCKLKQFGKDFNVVLYPKVAMQSYANLTTAYTQAKSGWIPSIYYDLEHYGIKICIPTTGASAGTQLYWIHVKYWIKCKEPK